MIRGNANHENTKGRYRIAKIKKDNFILQENKNHNRYLIYNFVKELYKPLLDFEKGRVDFTCHTYFPFDKISTYINRKEFIMEDSNIQYSLYYNKINIPEFVSLNFRHYFYNIIDLESISEFLYRGIEVWRNFIPNPLYDNGISRLSSSKLSVEKYRISTRKTSIKYSDYYPNHQIASSIKNQLLSQGIFDEIILEPLTFQELCDAFNSYEYDLLLNLSLPYFNHMFPILYYYLYLLDDKDIDDYILLLDKYISVHFLEFDTVKYCNSFNEYLKQILPCFPLFNGKHINLISNKFKAIRLEKNGEFEIGVRDKNTLKYSEDHFL